MWEQVAPMIVAIVFFVVTGGVILLRPLSKRLGHLIEAMTEERRTVPNLEGELSRIRESLESIEGRLRLVEERQDFTEELLGRGDGAKELPAETISVEED